MTDQEKQNSKLANDASIGIFDSGLGGLTVVKEVIARLPNENIVYLGDNARVPYGTRSAATIERYAWNCAGFLVERGIKMLVVACNTASAVAIESLKDRIDVPVLGVIRAGGKSACIPEAGKRVGVIGTAGTIGSGAYPKVIGELDPDAVVLQNPAPLLVPLVEEGWTDGEVPELAVTRYVSPLVEQNMDILLLGCTHYPILRPLIEQTLAKMQCAARVVDSATAMALEVEEALRETGLRRTADTRGTLHCCVTDLPASFADSAVRFLGHPIDDVEKVDIS